MNIENFKPAGKKITIKERKALADKGYKYCSCCQDVYLLEYFYNDSKRSDKLSSYCKACCGRRSLKRHHDTKNIKKEHKRWSKYGEINDKDSLKDYVPKELNLDEKKAIKMYLERIKPLAISKASQRMREANLNSF